MDRRSRARKTEMHALGSKIAFSGRNRCSSGVRGRPGELRGAAAGAGRGDECTGPVASYRRARVPFAKESARRSPATRVGAVPPGTPAFQMGTDAPAACQQFVPRRPFAACELRIAPISRDFAVIVILWQDRFQRRVNPREALAWPARAARTPAALASAGVSSLPSTLRATSPGRALSPPSWASPQ
jgi:hypothetical protein